MMNPSQNELREYWDQFAEKFRENERDTVILAQALFPHARLDSARRVLELGVGTGAAARLLHDRLPSSAHLTAVDISPNMVAIARSRLPDPVDVRVANAEALPFDDGAFDSVVANLVLMLVIDTDRALAEVMRVLAPGGVLVFSVWGRPELSPLFTLPPEAAAHAGIELPQGRRSQFHLGDRVALRERLQSHGFGRVISWYQAMVPRFDDGERYAEFIMRMPRWQGYLAEYPRAQVDAFRARLARLAQERLDRGDAIGLDALIAVADRASLLDDNRAGLDIEPG